mmetsp:Transcript_26562/g.62058  ORF Transcript_26562/g.62058 Transcript_26562/m.62058 type:complete len:226 (-) Transcript_26562:386-1063(-)
MLAVLARRKLGRAIPRASLHRRGRPSRKRSSATPRFGSWWRAVRTLVGWLQNPPTSRRLLPDAEGQAAASMGHLRWKAIVPVASPSALPIRMATGTRMPRSGQWCQTTTLCRSRRKSAEQRRRKLSRRRSCSVWGLPLHKQESSRTLRQGMSPLCCTRKCWQVMRSGQSAEAGSLLRRCKGETPAWLSKSADSTLTQPNVELRTLGWHRLLMRQSSQTTGELIGF